MMQRLVLGGAKATLDDGYTVCSFFGVFLASCCGCCGHRILVFVDRHLHLEPAGIESEESEREMGAIFGLSDSSRNNEVVQNVVPSSPYPDDAGGHSRGGGSMSQPPPPYNPNVPNPDAPPAYNPSALPASAPPPAYAANAVPVAVRQQLAVMGFAGADVDDGLLRACDYDVARVIDRLVGGGAGSVGGPPPAEAVLMYQQGGAPAPHPFPAGSRSNFSDGPPAPAVSAGMVGLGNAPPRPSGAAGGMVGAPETEKDSGALTESADDLKQHLRQRQISRQVY